MRGQKNGYVEWILWYNENPLTEYFTAIDINHGDDRSGMILETLYRKLSGQDIDIAGQIAEYKKHWMEAGFPNGIHPTIERKK
jgi:hypothetical protein